ncbi:MAG: DVUA0089 family protein [Treponema sp.]|jgi:hypothetical protein|nr:DVUA0089 family protein [Treponema sp.]
MTKRLTSCFVFFFALSVLYGQNSADPLPRLDGAVKDLAEAITGKIPAGENRKIILGQWSYRDSVPPLGRYWAAQLSEELANMPGRSFTLVSGGTADWTVSGVIIETPDTVRIYTRLLGSGDHAIEASFNSDFEFNEYIAGMLSEGGTSSSSVRRDTYESDTMENPVSVEITGTAGSFLNRTLHNESDEDFFLLTPDRDGVLTAETSGNDIDTFMQLYDAGSRNELAEDDDGGADTNALIRYEVHAGNRYIIKVRSYGGSGTGSYGFRARLTEPVRLDPDEYENDDESGSAKELSIGTPQYHTFTTAADVDWVTFRISRAGPYTILACGADSDELDTYIELYDEDLNSIDYDDDGGDNLDSFLSVRLQAGTYYLKVECFDDEPAQPYTVIVDEDKVK